jgi:hypothetical protein
MQLQAASVTIQRLPRADRDYRISQGPIATRLNVFGVRFAEVQQGFGLDQTLLVIAMPSHSAQLGSPVREPIRSRGKGGVAEDASVTRDTWGSLKGALRGGPLHRIVGCEVRLRALDSQYSNLIALCRMTWVLMVGRTAAMFAWKPILME